MTETVRFQPSRGVLITLGVFLALGILAFLAWIAGWRFGPIMFDDAPELDRGLILGFLILLGVFSAYGLANTVRGLPNLRISPREIVRTDILGRRTAIPLTALGPAYLASFGDHELVVFYKAERERALRAAGRFETPDKMTADVSLTVSNMRNEKLQGPEAICAFINANRSAPTAVHEADPAALAQVVAEHQRRVRLRRLLIPLAAAAAMAIEQFADDGTFGATAAYAALGVFIVVFLLDSLRQRGGLAARVATWSYALLALGFVVLTVSDIVAAA
jgi:hypothetical protein